MDAVLELPGGTPAYIRSSFIGDDRGSMSLRVTGDVASLEATSVIVPQWGAESEWGRGASRLRVHALLGTRTPHSTDFRFDF